jgi:hypothetical protein
VENLGRLIAYNQNDTDRPQGYSFFASLINQVEMSKYVCGGVAKI